ncbi:MAG: hypothetical protein GXX09_00145 [Syntrophomonadaceae bacterium]|nr:hypothetical protein [Syntrophomonadaceae bacterium]
MDKGDLFTIYLDGVQTTVFVVGIYKEECSGEDMVVLAVINNDNLLHIPLTDLNTFFAARNYVN